jgi:hypothetical protein
MFNLTLIWVQNEREKEKRSGGLSPGNQATDTAQKKSVYNQLSSIKPFLEQFRPGKAEGKISSTEGSKGLICLPNPDGRQVPDFFTFNKSGAIDDQDLVNVMLDQ